ncbi:FadR/GntR family transcriptional regulator [Mycolicibacterium smegmatis]|uniref:GntR family transcriptional regulator n=3 Tax=Mycobacteriaceae TaxID=1762 RepID=I7FGE2_MYCS2|nr:FadR/GntR family transcriptional regulator [Mycolicibacterium smegmatis]VTP02487.1 Putative L-lactate dehydrogenase operon regulatory protein [Mycobacterium riyadhense]ABK73942.1 GntR-family protein transcriptional regulator [Mycolicibacterium smegmatis MC2 155]AFP40480.1 GntR family transcriptional regulator [Mycolicibacterium smegmatis MC2 155]AIU09222.1 GntR family transcriptional regulator [Mycolicibacterium smegmatis MC2 155]AIU15847.1 GntR family transcriptional regulator [Mycolicibac
MALASSSDAHKAIGRAVLRPRQQVEETIKAAILSGELRSGEMLPPEAELARQFNVSRTTLREALRSLVSQHLITKIPGARGGNVVRAVDYRALSSVMTEAVDNLLALGGIGFDEVADVRQFLEVPSVRLAAKHRSSAELATLADIVQRQKEASVDDPDIPELDRQFHTLIAQASGNRVLASLVSALHQATEPVHYLNLSPEVGRETVRQHAAILRSVQHQDADAAEKAIVEHLTYLSRHIQAHRAN